MSTRYLVVILPAIVLTTACQSEGLDPTCNVPAALSAEGADSLLGEYTRVGDKLVGTIFFKGPITDEDREYLESLDVEIFYEFRGYDWAAARIPENVLPVLQNHPRIYGIELSTNAYLADCS